MHPFQEWDTPDMRFILNYHSHKTMDQLSESLGRPKLFIQDRLRELGIKKKTPSKYEFTSECKNSFCRDVLFDKTPAFCSKGCANAKNFIEKFPLSKVKTLHPKSKSVENLAKALEMSKTLTLLALDLADIPREVKRPNKRGKKRGRVNTQIGTREDLGLSVRSSWEANFLRYLNHKNIPWEYEPTTFVFEAIKRGTTTYTPDVLIYPDTKKEKWIEIKGYLRPQDKTKIKRFKKYYPEEYEKLLTVTKNPRVQSSQWFDEFGTPSYKYYDDLVKEFKDTIKNWE